MLAMTSRTAPIPIAQTGTDEDALDALIGALGGTVEPYVLRTC